MLKNYKEWVAEHPDIAKLGNPTPLEIAAIEIPMPESKKQLSINEWEAKDWKKIPGVGDVLAKRLTESGPYENIEDVKKIKGVSDKVLNNLKSLL